MGKLKGFEGTHKFTRVKQGNIERTGATEVVLTLCGDDESRSVGSPIEEELEKDKYDEEGAGAGLEFIKHAAEDTKKEHVHGESQHLDGLAANPLDSGDSNKVSGKEAGAGDNKITSGSLHQLAPGRSGGEVDGGQDGRLVEVDTIEGDVDEKPAERAADEGLEMVPLGEVLKELVVCLLADGAKLEADPSVVSNA